MAQIAELCFHAGPLAIEPGVGIGGRGVGLVRPPLARKLRVPFLPPLGGSPDPSFGRKLFIDAHRSQQRSIQSRRDDGQQAIAGPGSSCRRR